MMNWYSNMMGTYGSNGLWSFSIIYQLIILIDLILLGVWLWKHINKK